MICPVCDGWGWVVGGFYGGYTNSYPPTQVRKKIEYTACHGTGCIEEAVK